MNPWTQPSSVPRATLGPDRDVPVGVGEVTIEVELDTDADDAALRRFGALCERYRVVGQSLRVPSAVVVRRAAGHAAPARGGQSFSGPLSLPPLSRRRR